MRIISGILRGRIIHPPKNLRARPTTDFAKENLFNVLNNHWEFEGIDVLDLFAGTGSISYEFASRGARSVVAVEINAVHYEFIRSTARSFGCANLYPVKANAFLYLKNCSKQFDLIFADPPYDIEGSDAIPLLIANQNLLKNQGWIVLEHSKNLNCQNNPWWRETRVYGSVHFSFFVKPASKE